MEIEDFMVIKKPERERREAGRRQSLGIYKWGESSAEEMQVVQTSPGTGWPMQARLVNNTREL